MPPKYVPSSIDLKSFSCPSCGALADQKWYETHADPIKEKGLPLLLTKDRVKDMRHDDDFLKKFINIDHKNNFFRDYEEVASGKPTLSSSNSFFYSEYLVNNIHISLCFSCESISIWRYGNLIYPPLIFEVEPNSDLPDDIKADFDEARSILDLSPRGASALLRLCVQKLCKHLGQPGKNINKDIASLVKDGLDTKIQKALDIVRVTGNNAVHPGKMDLKDNREIAKKLFKVPR